MRELNRSVKGTENQLLDNAAAMMNACLGSSIGLIVLSGRWAAALGPSHGSKFGLLPCVFMSSKGMQQGAVARGLTHLCIRGFSIGISRGDNHDNT